MASKDVVIEASQRPGTTGKSRNGAIAEDDRLCTERQLLLTHEL